MITLITGTPGAGKTAYAVAQLVEALQAQPRPVYVMGIPELQLPHEVAPPVNEWTETQPAPEDPTLTEAVFTFPDGALIVIDEAQKVYRPRSAGSKVPDIVSAFEKHRHKGLDFWLVTQSPTLLDSNVRKLVGKHIHLRALWSGRKLYEWAECSDPESRTDRGAAAVRSYRLPKRVFGMYRSASLHIKQSRRLPTAVYVFGGVVAIGAALAWHNYQTIRGAIDGSGKYAQGAATAPAASGPVLGGAPGASLAPSGSGAPQVAPAGVTVAEYVPRISTRPETAPLYDGIRQVKALPVVAGCVAMAKRCTCYTEQGTDAFLTGEQCREWLRSPPFNPWRESVQQVQAPAPAAPASAPTPVEG